MAAPTLKKWAEASSGLKAGAFGHAQSDNHAGPAQDGLANQANDLLLRAGMVSLTHGSIEQQKYFLLKGIDLLKQCGTAPWPPNRSLTCADVLKKTLRENKNVLK